jgi:hypothetical protein
MHKVLSAASVGSVGDLARIARLLADREINIDAIGGGEAAVLGGTAGIISMLISRDDETAGQEEATLEEVVEELRALQLDGGRSLGDVQAYEALDVELDDSPGQMADAAALISEAGINIMSVMSVDVHANWAAVSLSFESAAVRDEARQILEGGGFTVMDPHGARRRRRRVTRVLNGRVLKGDRRREDED